MRYILLKEVNNNRIFLSMEREGKFVGSRCCSTGLLKGRKSNEATDRSLECLIYLRKCTNIEPNREKKVI